MEDEIEIKDNSKIKFYIKEENGEYYYYSYYHTRQDDTSIKMIMWNII